MRLTGAIPKQSNSTVQIWLPPWLNLQRKPELDLLPLELDFLYAVPVLAPCHQSVDGADFHITKRSRSPFGHPSN